MATASDVKLGGAFVSIFADDSRLVRGLKASRKSLDDWAAGAAKLGGGLFAGGLAALTPLTAATIKFGATGAHLDDLANRTGISAGSLSELGYAATMSGADLERMTGGVTKMQATLATPSDASNKLLSDLGVNAAKFRASAPEEQFLQMADAISRIEDPSRRVDMAMQVFGKSGAELLPMFEDGAAGIRALRDEGKQLGLTLSTADAAAAAKFDDSLEQLKGSTEAVTNALGAALAPSATELVTIVRDVVASTAKWIRANPEIVVGVSTVAASAVGAGSALLGLAAALKVASVAAGVAASAWVGTGAVIGAVTSPIGLTAAALLGLGYLAERQTGVISNSLYSLKPAWDTLKSDAQTTMEGVRAAFAAGDLKLAVEILWAAVQLEWARGTTFALRKTLELKDGALGYVDQLWGGIRLATSAGMNAVLGKWDALPNGVLTILDTLSVEAANKWDEIGQAGREAVALLNASLKYASDKMQGKSTGNLTQYMERELHTTEDVTKTRRETRVVELQERVKRRDDADAQDAAARKASQADYVDYIGKEIATEADQRAAEREKRLAAANASIDEAQRRLAEKVGQAKAAEQAAKKATEANEQAGQELEAAQGKTSQIGTSQAGVASRLFVNSVMIKTKTKSDGKDNEKAGESAGRAAGAAADAAMIAQAKMDAAKDSIGANAEAWTDWADSVEAAADQAAEAANGFSDGNVGKRRQEEADRGADQVAETATAKTPTSNTVTTTANRHQEAAVGVGPSNASTSDPTASHSKERPTPSNEWERRSFARTDAYHDNQERKQRVAKERQQRLEDAQRQRVAKPVTTNKPTRNLAAAATVGLALSIPQIPTPEPPPINAPQLNVSTYQARQDSLQQDRSTASVSVDVDGIEKRLETSNALLNSVVLGLNRVSSKLEGTYS